MRLIQANPDGSGDWTAARNLSFVFLAAAALAVFIAAYYTATDEAMDSTFLWVCAGIITLSAVTFSTLVMAYRFTSKRNERELARLREAIKNV